MVQDCRSDDHPPHPMGRGPLPPLPCWMPLPSVVGWGWAGRPAQPAPPVGLGVGGVDGTDGACRRKHGKCYTCMSHKPRRILSPMFAHTFICIYITYISTAQHRYKFVCVVLLAVLDLADCLDRGTRASKTNTGVYHCPAAAAPSWTPQPLLPGPWNLGPDKPWDPYHQGGGAD